MMRWIKDGVDSRGKDIGHLEWFFLYTLTDEEIDTFLADRKKIAQDLEHFHQLRKAAEKEKDFQYAKFIKKEIISDLESFQKAYNIVKFILIDGMGSMPDFPLELLPKIRYIQSKYQDLHMEGKLVR